jgi:hypothetical protein
MPPVVRRGILDRQGFLTMDQLISLAAAAKATGQLVRRLRNWCATGKLECELQDGEWHIPLAQLLLIAGVAADREQAIAAGRPVAAMIPVTTASPELPGEIARRLNLPDHSVSTSTLALDGQEYVVAVWRAGGDAAPDLAPVLDLVEELGGELLDGEISGT